MHPWTERTLKGMTFLMIGAVIAEQHVRGLVLPMELKAALMLILGVICLIGAWQRRSKGSVLGAAVQGAGGIAATVIGLLLF